MWIGLLYYFNVVQVPGLAAPPLTRAARAAPASANTSPRCALWWFRWAAVATWLTGCCTRCAVGNLARSRWRMTRRSASSTAIVTIGIGAWLGTIMLFNVWVLIWPNQKKILGIVAATDEEKAKARKVAAVRLAHRIHAVRSRC